MIFLLIAVLTLFPLFLHANTPLFTSNPAVYSTVMNQFMKGFFENFELPYPTQIINCYNEKGTKLFFDLLEVSYQLGQDLIEGETETYRPMIDSMDDLYDEMTPYLICQWQTQEWKNLLNKLDPNYEIPEKEAFYLQFMSKFIRLHTEGQIVEWSVLLDHTQQELIVGNYFRAGSEYGKAYTRAGFFFNNTMIEYLKFEAFDLGFIMAMDFRYEDSSIFCYTKEDVEPSIEWFYELAKAITEADIDDITNTTEEFFKSSGERIIHQLPEHVGKCLAGIPGTQRFHEKFGLDAQVPVFPYALTHFSKRRPEPYYNSMTYIWEKFDDWDFLNAGLAFGDLLKKVLNDYSYRGR